MSQVEPRIPIRTVGAREEQRALDPDTAELIAELDYRFGAGPLGDDVEARRARSREAGAMMHRSNPADVDGHDVQVVEAIVEAGEFSVPVREYLPDQRSSEQGTRGTLVYFHGGGWIAGSLDEYEPELCHLAARTGLRVVAPEYRLAPEHPFPAGFDDCRTVLADVLARSGAAPVLVGGDSSGANLALAVANEHRGAPAVHGMLLLYPALDPGAVGNSSYRRNGSGYVLTAADMEFYYRSYLRDVMDADPRATPLAARSLAGLPPTVVVTAGFDPLLDECVELARRLLADGVPVVSLPNGSLIHGFLLMRSRVPAAARAIDLSIDLLVTLSGVAQCALALSR